MNTKQQMVGSHALPAVSVMVEKMGYVLDGTIEMEVVDDGVPYMRKFLHAKHALHHTEHAVIWIGGFGWTGDGLETCAEVKVFRFQVFGPDLPKELSLFSVALMSISWEWKTAGCYVDESDGEGSIKPESVQWISLTHIDEYGQFAGMR